MAAWSRLGRSFLLRPLRRDVTRTALTIVSIALGVAVVIAIDLAGDAATGSFESSLTSLVGKVDFEITANGGVDEAYMGKLATLPLNARFSPVIEQPVGGTTLYGVDTVALGQTEGLEDTVTVSGELRRKKGEAIPLRGRRFTVREVVGDQSTGWIGMDIGAAQKLLAMEGRVDRIEVFLSPGQDAEQAEKAIRAAVPASYEIQTPGARSEENRRMLRAFRWNLRILSYISLVVGAFLIYNTIAVSVVRRRVEIGILRAIGLSRRGVMAIFLGEAALLGVVGSVPGILMGRALAAAIVGMISDTVNALFTTSRPGAIQLPWTSMLIALATGTSVALISALLPAREASRVAPAEAMRREAREHETRLNVRRDLAIAGGLAATAALLCLARPIDGRPVFGYVATLCAIASAAMLSPAFVTGVIGACHGALRRIAGAAGLIAGRSLVASLSRTSIVVTALATAISMMVSVGIMVGSFRETVQVWLDSQLRADIYLRGAGPATAGIYPPLDGAIPGIVSSTPGVRDVDVLHAFSFEFEGTRATFGASDMKLPLRFLAGHAPAPGEAIVSEPFSNKHGTRVGDTLQVPLGNQLVPLRVAGIYYDYSNDRGFVLTDRPTLLRYLPKQPSTNVAVYLKPGVDARIVQRDLETRLARFPLMIAPNEVLRRGAVEVFDRTFAVTYALEAVAILVAMLGAANSLLALVLDRRREIGLIRYLGADRGQVRKMILTEAGLLGLLAGLLGLVLGFALSLVLIYVVNRQSFGWTIQFHPPVMLLGGALMLVWAVTVLAGVYPARFASRLKPAENISQE